MKKIVSLLTFLIVSSTLSFAQIHRQFIPGSPVSFPEKGDTFRIFLRNQHSYPITVFGLWDRVGAETALRNKESYKQWLLAHMSGSNVIEKQISLCNAVACINKSPLFENRAIPITPWGNPRQVAKKNSVAGKHSWYDFKCGDVAEMSAHDLYLTGEFPNWTTSFRGLNVYDVHSILEVSLGDRWVKVDYDEGMPGFMEANPNSINGFASGQDLFQNPNLIVDSARYIWSNIDDPQSSYRDLCFWNSMERYREEVFSSANTVSYFSYTEIETEDISGNWILPPGAELSVTYVMDRYLIDTTGYSNIISYFIETNQMDSLIFIAMEILDVSEAEATNIIESGRIIVFDGIHFLDPYKVTNSLPYISLSIPAQPNPVVLGEDLSLPFVVHRASGNIRLGDTILFNPAVFDVVDTVMIDNTGPIMTDNQFHFLSEGLIPAGTPADFTLYFNPEYYSFWDGISFEVSGSDTLDWEIEYIPVNGVVTGLSEQKTLKSLYPNPVHIGGNVDGIVGAMVFDVLGNKVDISRYAPTVPGVYIVYRKWNNGFVIERLVVI